MDGGDIHGGGEHGREEWSLEENDKYNFKHAVNCLWYIRVKMSSRQLHARVWCLEKALGWRDRFLEV